MIHYYTCSYCKAEGETSVWEQTAEGLKRRSDLPQDSGSVCWDTDQLPSYLSGDQVDALPGHLSVEPDPETGKRVLSFSRAASELEAALHASEVVP